MVDAEVAWDDVIDGVKHVHDYREQDVDWRKVKLYA